NAEKWSRLLAMYEIHVGHAPNDKQGDDQRFDLYRKIADLSEHKLNSKPQAFAQLAKAYALRPDDLALEADLVPLAREADASADHVELLGVLRQRFAVTGDPEARIDLLYKIAAIEEEQAGDLDAAAVTYQRVLEEESHAPRALKALERIYQAKGNHPRLAGI